MSVRACVLTFTPTAGTGTQTIVGVQDAIGTFEGKVFLFQSGKCPINTVTAGGYPTNGYYDMRGVDTGTIRSALGVSDIYSAFNFKACSGAVSFGDASLLCQAVDSFGQVNPIGFAAKISAVRDGEFDILKASNDGDTGVVLVTVLGGDDLDVTFTNNTNGTYTTPTKPQGLISLSVPPPLSSGGTTWGTGGQDVCWGFATRDGVYGASDLQVLTQGTNLSAQRTDGWCVGINNSTNVQTARPTVSAWGDTSFTIANSPAIGMPMVLSGENLRCVAGSLTQPLTTGSQTFDTGIFAKWIGFFCTGYATSSATQFPIGQFSMGWATDATNQLGFWSGEKTPGNVSPLYGARYLSNSTVLRFATPNFSSTTFNSVAAVTDISEDGSVTLDWSVVDGTAREVLWFAIGEETPAPPTPSFTTRTLIRRRVRRAPVVWSEKGGFPVRITVNNFYLDLQPGVGNSDAPDPQVMIRASKDGGRTWGNERMMSAGRVGEYFKRVNAWRWGSGRAWVFEVSVSDSAVWNLINAYADMEPGDS